MGREDASHQPFSCILTRRFKSSLPTFTKMSRNFPISKHTGRSIFFSKEGAVCLSVRTKECAEKIHHINLFPISFSLWNSVSVSCALHEIVSKFFFQLYVIQEEQISNRIRTVCYPIRTREQAGKKDLFLVWIFLVLVSPLCLYEDEWKVSDTQTY